MIERLLGQPEVPAAAVAHLHDDERPRRARVNRDEIQLVPPDAEVAGKDGPACGLEAGADKAFGRVADPLRVASS